MTHHTLRAAMEGPGPFAGLAVTDKEILAEECGTCGADDGDQCTKTYGWPALEIIHLPAQQSHPLRVRMARGVKAASLGLPVTPGA